MDKFELLCDRDILAILDGDTKFGTIPLEEREQEVSMPYLSGNDICNMPTNSVAPWRMEE